MKNKKKLTEKKKKSLKKETDLIKIKVIQDDKIGKI